MKVFYIFAQKVCDRRLFSVKCVFSRLEGMKNWKENIIGFTQDNKTLRQIDLRPLIVGPCDIKRRGVTKEISLWDYAVSTYCGWPGGLPDTTFTLETISCILLNCSFDEACITDLSTSFYISEMYDILKHAIEIKNTL